MVALFCILTAAESRAQSIAQQAYVKAPNPDADDRFGTAVAASGDTLVIGAPNEDSTAAGIDGNQSNNDAGNSGAVYVYVRQGNAWVLQAYVKASNPAGNYRFGHAVACDQDSIVVGSWREDSGATGVDGDQFDTSATQSGAAYVFARDGVNWNQQAYLKASNTGANDNFGIAVSIHGNAVLVGASREASAAKGMDGNQADNSKVRAGAAYLFRRAASSWSQQAYVKASNTKEESNFGLAVAIADGQAVIGAPFEDGGAAGVNGNQNLFTKENSGAAYAFEVKPVIPLKGIAKKGLAAGPLDALFSTLGVACVNGNGQAVFESLLSGNDSKGGRNRAVFDTIGLTTDLALQSGVLLDALGAGFTGLKATRFYSPVSNQNALALFQASLSGPGSHRVLLADNGVTVSPVIRTGVAVAELGGASLSRLGEMAQHHTEDALAVCYRLKSDRTLGVNSKNDTGILLLKHDGTVLHSAAREGESTFDDNGVFGQFPGRVSMGDGEYAFFIAPYIPTGERKPVQRMFQIRKDGTLAFDYFPPTGTIAAGVDQDETFSRFIAVNERDFLAVLRATLKGGPKNQREGIWNCGSVLWLRKGVVFDPVNLPGVFVKRILKFWPVGADQLVVQVVLGGPRSSGVTSRNNQALLLRQADESWRVLMRSGSPAPGAAPATLSKISAVDVDRINGHYVVLGTLRGAPGSANQALWTGQTSLGSDDLSETNRLPVLRLRKGGFYSSEVTASGVMRGLTLKPVTHPGGAGARGQGQVIGAGGHVVLTVTGDRGVRELVVLNPPL